MSIENIAKRSGHLPVFQIADAVNQTLSEHNSIVITAAPGSGKSTILPLTMLQALGRGENNHSRTQENCSQTNR